MPSRANRFDSASSPAAVTGISPSCPAFALPSSSNQVQRPMLGVVLANQTGLAVISQLYEGGPAQQAGIRVGDQVQALDGRPIESQQQLVGELSRHKPADRITLSIVRNGWRRDFPVTIGSRQKVASLPTTRAEVSPSLPVTTSTTDDADWMSDEQYEELDRAAGRRHRF